MRRGGLTGLAALVLIPVICLAVIAIYGLISYRHAITADARREAEVWASDETVTQILTSLQDAAEKSPAVLLFEAIPAGSSAAEPEAETALREATASGDLESLRALRDSTATTSAGIPVAVLAGWRSFEINGDVIDCQQLARLAIHEHPSAISAPVIEMLAEHQLRAEWALSQEKRSILANHGDASGLVQTPSGVAFISAGSHVLTPEQIGKLLAEQRGDPAMPAWIERRFGLLGETLPGQPLASAGSDLRIVASIADSKLLYARYWRVVSWTAALIFCSIATAAVGIGLAQRTIARERRIGELKSQFVASVSHELRTPVASMRLMADALDAGKIKGAAAKDFHRLMSQEGARLSALIENVLDFARIEEGRKDYSFEPADLPALVTDIIHLMQPVAEERGVSIESDLATIPAIEIDSGAVEQALINLIANAIKFSPRGSTVAIKLTAANDSWHLSVADNGSGIPKRDRQRVFERFTRLGNELRRETQGTGIGLSIVKHIVEAHGATISIEDNTPTGTKFIIHSKSTPKLCGS